MHEIEEWLRKPRPDFEAGLVLVSKYAASKSTAGIFRRQGNNDGTLRSITDLLEKRLEDIKVRQSPLFKQAQNESLPEDKPIAQQPVKTPTPQVIAQPVVNQLKLTEANRTYSEMGMLHARIGIATDAERPALVKQLLQLQEKWAMLMVEAKTGQKPEPPKNSRTVTKVKELAPTALHELMLLRSKITKAKNEQIPNYERKLASNPNNHTVRNKLERRQKELAEWLKRKEELEKGEVVS